MTKTRFEAWAVFCLVAGLGLNCAADEENGIYLSTDRRAVYRKPAVSVPDKEGSLGLQQTSPAPVDQPPWPFVTGLPMPQGMVTDVSKVQLVGQNGDPIPAQFEALAHWSPKRQSVKWLRVAFSAPAQAGQSPQYSLKCGKAGPKLANPITVTQNADEVVVDTGNIAFSISKKAGGRLRSVKRAGTEIFRAASMDGSYVVDDTGAIYRASGDETPVVMIEESGPVRAVVRVESWHKRDRNSGFAGETPAGDRLNKCILRYYAYAGQPWIELHWTFVVAANRTDIRFKDIGLRLSGSGKTEVGIDGDTGLELKDGYLLQKKHDLHVIRRKTKKGYAEAAKGQRAPGWIVNDSFALVMRDFWQLFPKELEVVSTDDAKSQIVLHAWPGHSEYNQDWFIEPEPQPGPDARVENVAGPSGVQLSRAYFHNLQYFHHGPLLNFSKPHWWHGPLLAGARNAPLTWLDKENRKLSGWRAYEFFCLGAEAELADRNKAKVGTYLKENAIGTSRTMELMLDFSGDAPEHLASRRRMFVASPHVWLKDPQWLAQSRVFGPMNIPAANAWRQWSHEIWKARDASAHYGMWLHGNLPENFVADSTPALYRMLGGSVHYGHSATEWLLYMCTGQPDHLRHARANTHQHRDVEIVHWTSPDFSALPELERKVLGATNTVSAYPWRLGSCFGFYAKCDYLLWDYYLRGDRRSLETARLHADGVMKFDNGKNLTRSAGGTLKTLIDWYAHNWDAAVAAKIDDIIQWIIRNDPTGQTNKKTMLNWTNWMPQYLRLTKDPDVALRLRKEMLAFVVKWLGNTHEEDFARTGYSQAPGNNLAAMWFATGDSKYLMPFVRSKFKARVPRKHWLVPDAPPRLIGSSYKAGRFDEVLFAHAAWKAAMDKDLIPPMVVPASENYPRQMLPSPGCEEVGKGPGPAAWVTDETGYGAKVTDDVLPQGWVLHAKSWSTLKVVDDVFHSGQRSQCVIPAPGGATEEKPSHFRVDIAQTEPAVVRRGQIYHISFWYKTTGVANISTQIQLFGPLGFNPISGKNFRIVNLVASGASANWRRLHAYLTIPPKGERLGPLVLQGSLRSRDAKIWVDDLSLKPVLTVDLPLVQQTPVIDGRLEDAAWSAAEVIDWTKALSPADDEKATPVQETNCYLLIDVQNLYIGVRCVEPNPEVIHAVAADRDSDIVGNFDHVKIIIAPKRTQETAVYQFIVNAAGSYAEQRNGDASWNPNWKVKVVREKGAWTIEARIPITELGYQAWPQAGFIPFNLIRARKPTGGRARLSSWSPPVTDVDVVEDMGLLILD